MTHLASIDDIARDPTTEWDQGDIVEAVYFAAQDAALPGVLVTPACDVDQAKVEFWTFVALFPDSDVASTLLEKDVETWKAGGAGLTKNQREAASKRIRELMVQRFPRYHWLPVPFGQYPAYVADFCCVTSLPVEEVRQNAKRVKALASSWREQLPARYASYMARVGTSDFVREELDAQVARVLGVVAGA